MKVNRFFLIIIFQFYFVLSCHTPRAERDVATIEIEMELGKPLSTVRFSEIFHSIEYIPLETPSNAIIGNNPIFEATQKYIIVKDRNNCFVFDRKSGEFIRKIGRQGRGPGGYHTTWGFIDPFKEILIFSDWAFGLIEYDFEGNYLRSIPIPEYKLQPPHFSVPIQFTHWGDYIVTYFLNATGEETKLLLVFNRDGETIYIHENSNIILEENPISGRNDESQFYHYENNLYFKENFNDTIYQVIHNDLVAHTVMHTGKYLWPYELKWLPYEMVEKTHLELFKLTNIFESGSHLFFHFHLTNQPDKKILGLFDKNFNQLKLLDSDKGIEDDIYEFVPLNPLSLTIHNEAMGYIEGYKVENWFKENPEKVARLPPHLIKLQNISENDNPLVIFAKLKE
jgi:hypothetical protein